MRNPKNTANIEKLCTAVNHIRIAIAALDSVEMSTDDARYYAYQLRELLSSDDGECGLDALIKLLEEKNA